ncbi:MULTISPECIES: trypsin-like peptidase domain-containing protein [Streptomyces]|uniref:trypsin-like peptidase domain-containing protein n=1 Tax=Streptomyces TaxID=1883 RepID=UPI00163CA989|nr:MULTISPECIES: trypsin-like peptidase domain-containing protein [Streptomyces]MBC2876483.1 serine protease [Streptomyces sp. TYQ1024]UBI40843.1 trypsin-like peptidase domain-containing protein [Streptomyces mobaraensis]
MLSVERVAEVVVALPGGGGRRGSGYLVAPGRVLTAAHVVDDALAIRVRFDADRPGERTGTADVVWMHPGIDVAVLGVADEGTGVAPAAFGRLGEQDAVVRCTAVGFPRFKLRTDEDGSRYRDAEHVHTSCAALSNRREGTLDLRVDAPPADDPDAGRDAWEGMSGAAVFSGGHLVSVVTRHHRSDGPGRIAAGRVDRWAEVLAADELDALEKALGSGVRPVLLPDVLPATQLGLLQEFHRAHLADYAPEELRDRRRETEALVAFCGGAEPYLWLQGPPWAGKTALTAWFALHPPRGVVPVWFFVTARDAGQSDSGACSEALVDQLAAIADREPVSRGPSPAHDGERGLLLRQAAERVARDGGTLLLIVDGLDEDQSLRPGGTGRSIAALLPERLPPGVRVLVTSRSGVEVPADVKGGHPLRTCPVMDLPANAAARHTEHEARYELQQALFGGTPTERDLVGLFTAARGPLTAGDLRALTGEPEFVLRRLLGGSFGRILRPQATGTPGRNGDGTASLAKSRGYAFSHDTLLAVALEEFGPDLDPYRERLHTWAAGYAAEGWPAGTPAYLLRPYGRMLAALQDPRDARRAVSLATDTRRHERFREETGSDAACLAEIAAVREAVYGLGASAGLDALAALAVTEDLVARRNEQLHYDVPAAYARLGKVRLAVGLARSVFHPLHRSTALQRLARVLAEAGDRRAAGLAEEAVRLAEGELRGSDPKVALTCLWTALGIQSAALARTGRREEAMTILARVPQPRNNHGERASFAHAMTIAAVALRDAETSSGLLRAAEEAVHGIDSPPQRASELSVLARAWQDCGFPEERDRLHDKLLTLVHDRPRDARLPPIAARALRATRPEVANALIDSALIEPAHGFGHGPDAVFAFIAAGRMPDAQRFAARLDPEKSREQWDGDVHRWGQIANALAEGWARWGEAAAAWTALELSWSSTTDKLYRDGSATTVATLLAESGRAAEAEAWLTSTEVLPRHVAAEAFSALALHHAADDPDRSLRLLYQAVHGSRPGSRTIASHQQNHFVPLAGALAAAGRPDTAERLVAAFSDPAVRIRGLATVSLAVRSAYPGRALRLVEQAISLGPKADLRRAPGAETAIYQALAGAGAAERVTEALDYLEDVTESADALNRARLEAATLLWPHDPDAAADLLDLAVSDLLDRSDGASYIQFVQALVAVGRHDDKRASTLKGILDDREPRTYRRYLHPRWSYPSGDAYVDTVPAGLLAAVRYGPHTRYHSIDAVAEEDEGVTLPAARAGAVALAYAALGDHQPALDRARRARNEAERSEVLAQLAAYYACLPGDSVAAPLYEDASDILPTIRRLAGLVLPPPSGPDIPRAEALLAEALTPGGWHHAVSVLVELDPAAALDAGDIVLAHLGVEG